MVKIAPSILSAEWEHLKEDIQSVTDAGADMIHIDIMDGKFVENVTPGMEMYKMVKKTSNLPADIHLMVEDPETWIDEILAVSKKQQILRKRTDGRSTR